MRYAIIRSNRNTEDETMNLPPATRATLDRFITDRDNGTTLADSLLDTSDRQFREGVSLDLASLYPAVTVTARVVDRAKWDGYEDWASDVTIRQGGKIVGAWTTSYDMQYCGPDVDSGIAEACEVIATMLAEAFPLLPGGCERCGMMTVGGADDRERDGAHGPVRVVGRKR
jgi:hypothetical protein